MQRISWWLPGGALAAALIMAVLALMAMRAGSERHDLALQGRILGLAHSVETEIREKGIVSADQVLTKLHEEAGTEVRGLTLRDSSGGMIASVGTADGGSAVQKIDLFLGRSADAERGQRGGGFRGYGRGRAQLDVVMAPEAVRTPVATRLVFPVAVFVGLVLVALAVLGSRLLERNRRLEIESVDRRRLEGLARAGAGLAHQIRTPLATIKGSCQLIQEELPDGGRSSRRVQAAIQEADRMERILHLLLDYARPPSPHPVSVSLSTVFELLSDRWPEVVFGKPDGLEAYADPDHVQELLGNLIENAVQVSPDTHSVRVSVEKRAAMVAIEIFDQGPGPGSDPEELFEPYVTGRAEGTGLGLPIARNLAEANGGTIELRARVEGGCVARLLLPTRVS